jgi:protein-S-isoprenylcysteine O-methyltransferase Ste14
MRTARFGIVEFLASAEIFVLAAMAYPLYRAAVDSASSLLSTAAAVIGAVLAAVYVALLVGSITSWRGAHTGQLVLDDQTLVRSGLYGLIRHPLYAGALVLWVAVSVADLSVVAAAVTLVFVVPTYIANIAREEEMMQAAFGDDYLKYRATVPRFIPSLRRGSLCGDRAPSRR